MERVKKILSSPMSRKKFPQSVAQPDPGLHDTGDDLGDQPRYIGVALADIVQREHTEIPNLVTNVCFYIYEHGMECEGVFRINGNSRVVDKLRTSYNITGDADLHEAGDVMAVAGLLKLFLRELPEGLIPENLTKVFVDIQEEYANKVEICLQKLHVLLRQLPHPQYQTLKFLAKFLVLISKKASINKMNPMALGIVFGPNLFRCTGGMQGLKDQGITNHIALKFITHYDNLFLEDGEVSPNSPDFVLSLTTRKLYFEHSGNSRRRKSDRNKKHTNGLSSHHLAVPVLNLSPEHLTDHPSDDEGIDTNRSNSPFNLESDRSEFSILASPRVPPPSIPELDTVISSAVKELLFGDPISGLESDDSMNSQNAPVPAPRRKRRQAEKPVTPIKEMSAVENQTSVKERVSLLQAAGSPADERDDGRPKKQRPTSKAFEMFEKQGIIIGVAPTLTSPEHQSDSEDGSSTGRELTNQKPVPKVRSSSKRPSSPSRSNTESGVDFGEIPERTHSILPAFKRVSGPSNRRTPSRQHRRNSDEHISVSEHSLSSNNSTTNIDIEQPPKVRPFLKETVGGNTGGDINHNGNKPSIDFLNQRDDLSPDKSPTATRKPYIPPLDLTILHEHGDGSDPIPAEQGYSVSLQKAHQYADDNEAILSPRTSKLKYKKSIHLDTDIPPSPPTDQMHIPSKRGVDDDNALLMKQLTKKIQSCKKRIKLFEETFEQEHGYRPSQSDKAARPEIKRHMLELQKSRKDLRKLKEELDAERMAASSPSGLAVLPNGRTAYTEGITEQPPTMGQQPPTMGQQLPTMDQTLQMLLKKLTEKRDEDDRPENLHENTREETMEEKIAVQKALLHFENIHGRPTTKAEKSLMRPLYDRYRNIKRILAKQTSPREKLSELQSVPEDQPIEFTPSTDSGREQRPDLADDESDDFAVTKDFRLMKSNTRSDAFNSVYNSEMSLQTLSKNVHELTVPELLDEQRRVRMEKKRLRRVLREFEEDYLHQTGSKVQKEDRAPMEIEYNQYKQVKARLKLLEALISKHDPMSAY